MNLLETIQQVRTLQMELEKKDAAMKVIRKKLTKGTQAIADMCMSVCVKAAAECNRSTRLQIDLKYIQISPDIKKNTLELSVYLKPPIGCRPEEELDSDDVEDIRSRLRGILNRELKAAKIPLNFGGLSAG
ncbi:MAG: hypothetical protein ACYC75_02495 [Minisyncoccota bacterium]